MELASNDGQFLALGILGYEFPHMQTEPYDSNWLIIAGNVTHPRGSWQFTVPCLLTYEAERLASWMDTVAEPGLRPSTCGFLEPNLEFRTLFNVERPVLRVYFDLETRPPWELPGYTGKADIWVEFPIEELDLRSAARQWRTELAVYPQRAAR